MRPTEVRDVFERFGPVGRQKFVAAGTKNQARGQDGTGTKPEPGTKGTKQTDEAGNGSETK